MVRFAALMLAFAALALILPAVAAQDPHRFNSRHDTEAAGVLEQGHSFNHTFTQAGTYTYYCDVHPSNMAGSVEVFSDAASSGTVNVRIKDFAFDPPTLQVKPGTRVVWTNHDSTGHTVVERPDSPGTQLIPTSTPPTQSSQPKAGGGGLPGAAIPFILVGIAAALAFRTKPSE